MKEKDTSKSRGGIARAKKLTKEERSEIARKAARARWDNMRSQDSFKAILEDEIIIGDINIPCAVLENETRLLSERGITKAFGGKRGGAHWKRLKEGGAYLPVYVSAKNLQPFIDEELQAALNSPIFHITKKGGRAYGLNAELFPKVCEVWLKAKDAGVLRPTQIHIAQKADILIRGLATVGIVALIDEATGFDKIRARRSLNKILDEYISKELRKWTKMFPDEFYEQMFRLRGWEYTPFTVKRPSCVGTYTNDIVYDRLAPGILDELKKKTPKTPKGHRRHRYFLWLTEDVGDPRLREHLAAVIALMRASSSWRSFKNLLQRAFPKYGTNLDLPFPIPENEDDCR